MRVHSSTLRGDFKHTKMSKCGVDEAKRSESADSCWGTFANAPRNSRKPLPTTNPPLLLCFRLVVFIPILRLQPCHWMPAIITMNDFSVGSWQLANILHWLLVTFLCTFHKGQQRPWMLASISIKLVPATFTNCLGPTSSIKTTQNRSSRVDWRLFHMGHGGKHISATKALVPKTHAKV